MNLVDALQQANNKSRQFLAELDETAKLFGHASADNHPGLRTSKILTQALIGQTERAIASGDVMLMLAAAGAHGLDAKQEDHADARS